MQLQIFITVPLYQKWILHFLTELLTQITLIYLAPFIHLMQLSKEALQNENSKEQTS